MNNNLTKTIESILGESFSASNETHKAALFLFGAVDCGSLSPKKIGSHTGLTENDCKTFAARAKETGIFTGRKIAGADWLDEETGGVAFLMDAMVLSGLLDRCAA